MDITIPNNAMFLCSMLYVPCSMFYVPCSMFYVLCRSGIGSRLSDRRAEDAFCSVMINPELLNNMSVRYAPVLTTTLSDHHC